MKIRIELYSGMTEKHYQFEHKYRGDEEAEPIREWLAEDIFPEIEQAAAELFPDLHPHSDVITEEAEDSPIDIEIYAEHDYDELYRTDEYDPDSFDKIVWMRGIMFSSVYQNYFEHLETGYKCRRMKGWRGKN